MLGTVFAETALNVLVTGQPHWSRPTRPYFTFFPFFPSDRWEEEFHDASDETGPRDGARSCNAGVSVNRDDRGKRFRLEQRFDKRQPQRQQQQERESK